MEWFILLLLIMLAIGMFFRGIVALTITVILMSSGNPILGIVVGIITYIVMHLVFPNKEGSIEPEKELGD